MITYLKKTKYGNVEKFSGEAGDMMRDRDRLYNFQTGKIILNSPFYSPSLYSVSTVAFSKDPYQQSRNFKM